MKKKITKIFGVGLVVVLLVSLLSFAAPVSGSTLLWTTETIPTTTSNVTLEGSANITDIAVGSDGNFIVAGSGTTYFYKSSDRGASWSAVAASINATLVAVAPDDNDIIAWVDPDTTSLTVRVTDSGGTFQDSLGVPTGAVGISDVAISADRFGSHRVAVSGRTATGAEVWEWEMGSAAPSWSALSGTDFREETSPDSTAIAVAFSPNYASDEVLVALTAGWNSGWDNATVADNISIEMYSFDSYAWNTGAGFTGYPVAVAATTTLTGVIAGDLSLSPDYLGSDNAFRLSFVGLDLSTATTLNGVYRAEDDTVNAVKIGTGVRLKSVAYDGTNLVAGRNDETTTYYCADPLATSPTVVTTSSMKSPSGTANTTLAWAGDDVVSGTQGDDCAFALSSNNGKSYNDISLIDTKLVTLTDIAVSADGSRVYMATDDVGAEDASVWRLDGSTWMRILNIQAKGGFILRGAPDDSDVLYVVDQGATTIYYTSDAGDSRWQLRTAGEAIQDLSVEGDGDTSYALSSGGGVRKSTNAGFTWGSSEDTLLAGGNMLQSLGDGAVIVGSTDSYVSYSADSGDTWTKIPKPVVSGGGNVQVTASGVADGDYIYASAVATADSVYRWQIGTSVVWKDIGGYAALDGDASGMLMWDGDLYVLSANATGGGDSAFNLSDYPVLSPTVYWTTDTSTAQFSKAPQALSISTDSNGDKLWAIDNVGEELYSYLNTMRTIAPTLISPSDGYSINVNPVSGIAMNVALIWERPSEEVTNYEIKIYLDAAGDEEVADLSKDEDGTPVSRVVTSNDVTLMPGTTYYWKVRADAPIKSAYSEMRSFTISPLVAMVPSILAPENGATSVSALPSFSWSPVGGATEYQFKIADNVALGNPTADVKVKTTGYALTKALEEGKTYFWSVKALAPVAGGWSALANFTVMVTPPAPAAPAPPVVIKEVPAPVINIPAAPPAQQIVIPPAPPAPAPITPAYIWAIIIIGAILVIAVIVLIVRTRRAV